MKNSTIKFTFLSVLMLFPFAFAYALFLDQSLYANSEHISSPWDQNEPTVLLAAGEALRQSFDPPDSYLLSRIDLMLQSGAGEYEFQLDREGPSGLLTIKNPFDRDDFQNHDFARFEFNLPIEIIEGDILTVTVTRIDEASEAGIGFFFSSNDYAPNADYIYSKGDLHGLNGDIVLQVYNHHTQYFD